MSDFKKCGKVYGWSEPYFKEGIKDAEHLVFQELTLNCGTEEKPVIIPFKVFKDNMTQDNMQHIAVGNLVTFSGYINANASKNDPSKFFISLTVSMIEAGDTTGNTRERKENDNPVIAGMPGFGAQEPEF